MKRVLANRKKLSDPQLHYPWDKWFNEVKRGKEVVLKYHEDFQCLPHAMAQQFRNHSAIRKIPLTVEIYQDGLVVQKKLDRNKKKFRKKTSTRTK